MPHIEGNTSKARVLVLISGTGSNLEALIEYSRLNPDCPYRVTKVVADRPCRGLEKAAKSGIKAIALDRRDPEFGPRLLEEAKDQDFIVLAGYLSILEPAFIAAHRGRIINIHPSLLPRHGGSGMYGLKVHESVLAAGDTESGCTVHLVDEGVDSGQILLQRNLPVRPDDTAIALRDRILVLEHDCIVKGLLRLIDEFSKKKGYGFSMNALLSVFYKDGILELAHFLIKKGFTIISSGGTFKYLSEHGIQARSVDDVTGFPEMLDGRVKTLHPRIHGGLLARRDLPEHMSVIKEHDIEPIDLVCVNLYPFREKLAEGLPFQEMIEYIDIGGPSMLRSAAKNFDSVYVLSSPAQYTEFMTCYEANANLAELRRDLAGAVFRLTAAYDQEIADWLSVAPEKTPEAAPNIVSDPFPEHLTLNLTKQQELRYAENPHQKGSFYSIDGKTGFMTSFIQHNGKALGYINFKDLEAAWRIVSDFEETCCAAVKHNTPCGVALGKDPRDAYQRAYDCDPLSIFGGIVAVNREIDEACAQKMTEIMLHMVCAPSFTPEALAIFRQKKNLIIIEMKEAPGKNYSLISSDGGVLLQEEDELLYNELTVVTKLAPDPEDLAELLFAMKVVKFVKSNAIVVSKAKMATGIGGGFVNRIDATRYALQRAQGGHCLASDAFFPFADVVEEANKYGITAIIQPGGSLNDQMSIAKCDELGIAMVFTGLRHFRH